MRFFFVQNLRPIVTDRQGYLRRLIAAFLFRGFCVDKLLAMLKTHEGLRLTLYKCPAGKWTIGYGRNLEDRGISEDEAQLFLENDVKYFYTQLEKFPAFHKCNEARQIVLVNMAFNLGIEGLRNFKMMWAAISLENWQGASIQMLRSKWAGQVGNRATELAEIMRTGVI